jgi:hypothetical protein
MKRYCDHNLAVFFRGIHFNELGEFRDCDRYLANKSFDALTQQMIARKLQENSSKLNDHY